VLIVVDADNDDVVQLEQRIVEIVRANAPTRAVGLPGHRGDGGLLPRRSARAQGRVSVGGYGRRRGLRPDSIVARQSGSERSSATTASARWHGPR